MDEKEPPASENKPPASESKPPASENKPPASSANSPELAPSGRPALHGLFALAALLASLPPLLTITGFCFGVRALDPDYYWHVALGRVMLQRGTFPYEDTLSWTAYGKWWHNHSYGADLLFALGDGRLGFDGMRVAYGLLLLLAAGCWYALLRGDDGRRPPWRPWAALTLVGWCFWASSTVALVRPLGITFFGFCALPLALQAVARGVAAEGRVPAAFRALPLAFLVWGNLHGGWLLALAGLGAFLAGDLVDRRLRPGLALLPGPAWREVALLALAAAFATLVTPYGLENWRQILAVAGDPEARQVMAFVDEWQPYAWALNPPFNVLLAATALLLPLTARRLPLAWLLPAAGLIYAAFSQQRHVPEAVAGLVPVLALMPAALRVPAPLRLGPGLAPRLRQALGALLSTLAGLAMIFIALPSIPHIPGLFYGYPSRAAIARLQALPTERRIYHPFAWGGVFAATLLPRQRVFMDGRGFLFGPRLLTDELDLLIAAPRWPRLLDTYAIDLVVIPPIARLSDVLDEAPGWRRTFMDQTAAIYERAPLKPPPPR